MDALSADVWACVLETLSNSAICNLSACNKACRQISCYNRTLKLELDGNGELHSCLVSLLHFLTSRREHLQVCCVLKAADWFSGYFVLYGKTFLVTSVRSQCVRAAPSCAGYFLQHHAPCMQVTCLEVSIHVVPNKEDLDERTARYRETAMAVLACIVVACSARLEALALHLDWCCADAWAQDLLVRQLWLSLQYFALVCLPSGWSAEEGTELPTIYPSVCMPAVCGGAVPAAALAAARSTNNRSRLGTEQSAKSSFYSLLHKKWSTE